jgi:Double zinc ribbon
MCCPRCQVDTPPPHRYCAQCEIPLEAYCPQCEASLRSAAKFWGSVGIACPALKPRRWPGRYRQSQPPPAHCRLVPYTPQHLTDKVLRGRAALQGERCPVIVLCTDVVGFSPLALQLDSAAIHTIHYGCVL